MKENSEVINDIIYDEKMTFEHSQSAIIQPPTNAFKRAESRASRRHPAE